MKHFYSHLVEIDFLHEELTSLDLSNDEKEELLTHVHSSIHYTVLDTVLSELPEDQKNTFIDHLNAQNHDKIWQHLKDATSGIEGKIREAAANVAKEFVKEARLIKERHQT